MSPLTDTEAAGSPWPCHRHDRHLHRLRGSSPLAPCGHPSESDGWCTFPMAAMTVYDLLMMETHGELCQFSVLSARLQVCCCDLSCHSVMQS
mmetsp:Transcript_25413/g.38614  ORF Transcript_25413/g.38614 Transcript_25413/m.38614 type:complete len:92 (+) Transcript_25413:637-912(+)